MNNEETAKIIRIGTSAPSKEGKRLILAEQKKRLAATLASAYNETQPLVGVSGPPTKNPSTEETRPTPVHFAESNPSARNFFEKSPLNPPLPTDLMFERLKREEPALPPAVERTQIIRPTEEVLRAYKQMKSESSERPKAEPAIQPLKTPKAPLDIETTKPTPAVAEEIPAAVPTQEAQPTPEPQPTPQPLPEAPEEQPAAEAQPTPETPEVPPTPETVEEAIPAPETEMPPEQPVPYESLADTLRQTLNAPSPERVLILEADRKRINPLLDQLAQAKSTEDAQPILEQVWSFANTLQDSVKDKLDPWHDHMWRVASGMQRTLNLEVPHAIEAQKKNKYQKVLDEQFMLMLGKVNAEQRRRNQELTYEKVVSDIRGGMVEELSKITSFESGKTVYTAPNVPQPVLSTFQYHYEEEFGKKPEEFVTKREILEDSLQTILSKGTYTKEQVKTMRNRLNETTIIPDEGLYDETGMIIGFTETKGYLPSELANIDEVAADLSGRLKKEANFVNIIRLTSGKEKLYDMPILLRFPSNAPEASLQQLGEALKAKGYSQVIIQQLSASTDELEAWAKESAQKQLDQIRAKKNNKGKDEFPPEFIDLLTRFSAESTIAKEQSPTEVPKPEEKIVQPVATVEGAPMPEAKEFSEQTITQTAEIAHELWKDVFRRQNGADAERWKKLDPTKPIDQQTVDRLEGTNAFRKDVDGMAWVNIMQVGFHDLPSSIQESTIKNVTIARNAIEASQKELEANLPQTSTEEYAQMINADIQEVKRTMQKAERGEKLEEHERDLLNGPIDNWVTKTASDIHASWASDNTQRTELQQQFFTLDPYEQEKDVIFLEAALRSSFTKA